MTTSSVILNISPLIIITAHDSTRYVRNLRSPNSAIKNIVGGWSPNWVHSARRPFTGLLYLPRVIVRMENLVAWMAGETEVLRLKT
jgi:hypothetical protein